MGQWYGVGGRLQCTAYPNVLFVLMNLVPMFCINLCDGKSAQMTPVPMLKTLTRDKTHLLDLTNKKYISIVN